MLFLGLGQTFSNFENDHTEKTRGFYFIFTSVNYEPKNVKIKEYF